jgi:L-seryl-tRNA(Ser) seleniumtransferase
MPRKSALPSSATTGVSRRDLLRSTPLLAASLAASPLLESSAFAEPAAAASVDYYDKLGVDKIINAAGTYTFLTAAVMPPQVIAAVARAAQHPVVLADLHKAAGEYLAKKLRCEAALVTSGASAALTLSTAACIMAANPGARPEQIPQEVWATHGKPGMKNEVIVQKSHRYEYDHAMQLCGVRIVEVVTLDDYKRAFTPNTIMTNFFNSEESGQIDRETWLRVAHEHNVPCHLDAAADMPPIENLWKYTGMGFDLVCFSGGKGIRGPQNAGLLLGRRKLIDLARENDSPNSDAVGRGMKVAKEQIVGMVAAVDWLLEQKDETFQAEYMRRAKVIEEAVKGVPTMKAEIYIPEVANHVPHLILTYDPSVVGVTPNQVKERLSAAKPRIELNPATGTKGRLGPHSSDNSIVLATWMLAPGEDVIVARTLHQVLMAKHA